MSEASASQREEDQQLDEKLDELLGDPEKRAAILRKLGVASPTSSLSGGSCTPVGDSGKKDSQSEHPTLSGKSMGERRGPPAPFGGQSLWWPQGSFPPSQAFLREHKPRLQCPIGHTPMARHQFLQPLLLQPQTQGRGLPQWQWKMSLM